MRINHITIQCSDLDRSIKFYEEVVGLSIVNDMRGKGPFNIVFLANDANESSIELIQNNEDSFNGEGISIGFGCNDVEAYHQELTDKGHTPTPIISPNPNVKFFFIEDPDGVKIQFIN